MPVGGVEETIAIRIHAVVRDHLSRVHAAWGFQASRFTAGNPRPLKVCQPVSTGFPLPQPKSIRCGTIGALRWALNLYAFPCIAPRSAPPVLGKSNVCRDEVLLTCLNRTQYAVRVTAACH